MNSVGALASRFEPSRVRAFAAELRNLEMLQPSGSLRPINPAGVKVASYPLSTLVLNVNTGCNLSCTYCYKEDLAKPVDGRKMDFVTAARSVDLLLKTGASRDRLNVVFFGGEPLTNVPLIRQVTAYAQAEAKRAGKGGGFFADDERDAADPRTDRLLRRAPLRDLGIHGRPEGAARSASQERRGAGNLRCRRPQGPHAARPLSLEAGGREGDAGRRQHRGRGHSRAFARRARISRGRLCAGDVRRRGRPCAVGAELVEVHRAFERLGEDYRRAALRGENNGFSNMHQLMTDLHEGRRKSLPCGAGVGFLAVDGEGDLNLCHRFTGSDMPRFGNVTAGIDGERLGAFIEKAIDREGTHCETCRIRNLCAGGCYHESYARFGDAHHRTYHYCDLLRSWVDFGVRVYADIQRQNPSFFTRHLEPRSVPA